MPRPSWQTALTNRIIVSVILIGWTNWGAAQSQPLADDTLGNERSIVMPLDSSTPGDRIEGGARRGDNLFHSLQQLNIDTGRSVYFSDPGVDNIITRVTGGTSSQIDGILGVQGNANLFLINPSGIIFGAEAQLDVGGSFTATTADAIEFGDRGNFSATNPTAVPLLTVQPSAFVFNQINPAPIANNSIAAAETNPSGFPGLGLRVPEGEGLTLLGGNISMNGGGVNALGGRVEIGGLSVPGTVIRNADGSLSFPDGIAPADVSLTNQSLVDVAADGGGSITVNAGDFEISESFLAAGIGNNSGFVSAQAGDITLNANNIRGGELARISNLVREGGIGNAGDINITTGSLSLTNGTLLSANTLGEGNAGDIIINASDRVSLDRASAIFSSVGAVNLNTIGVGEGGDIRITTGSLILTDGSQLQATTFGQGNAGDVIINARDSISLEGVSRAGIPFPSAILTDVLSGAQGQGGDISITTGSLSLLDGARLVANTFGQGDAGNVIINARENVSLDGFATVILTTTLTGAEGQGGDVSITADSIRLTNSSFIAANTDNFAPGGSVTFNANTLEVTGGAQVLTTTSGTGGAGNITLNITDRITLSGSNPINIPFTGQAASGLYASTNPDSSGIGGTVQINTDKLELFDGAAISVNSQGEGKAGDIEITANRVQLNNSARLSAETTTVNGGNITLNNVELLQLGNGSSISTTAGTDRAGGNGGNININSDLIVAFPNENSDIRANAFTGSGGNVRIDSQGLFGIAFQVQDNPLTSDITASSEQGLQGNVFIILPDVDPQSGLTQLPEEVVDVSSRIAQGCRSSDGARQNRGEFIVKGRGGLPPSPTDSLVGDESLATWVTLETTTEAETSTVPAPKTATTAAPIVEAQAWIVDKNGNVQLIANAPTSATQPHLICQRQENK